MTREEFEAWVIRDGGYLNDPDDAAKAARLIASRAWQAATAAERERCAKVCESLRDTISDPLVIGEDAYHAGHNALQSVADAIRKGK